jgi:hypothetical protein
MNKDEIRERYDLTDSKQIAIFVVLAVMILIGIALGIMTLVLHGDKPAYFIGGIVHIPLFIFFLVYALFGYKMRILSFQILMLVLALSIAVLSGLRFYNRDHAYAITDLLIVGCLVGFVFTIKRTDATPRVLLISTLALQIPLTIFNEVANFSSSAIDWSLVAEALQMSVVFFVANGIYYSRIARHPIIDPARAGEKSFK